MNQKVASLLAMTCCVAGVGRAWALEPGAAEAALAALRVQFPDAVISQDGQPLTRVAGVPLASGASPEQSADAFRLAHAEAFGVVPTDLQAQPLAPGGPLVQAVMYLPDLGTFKFMLARYRQECGGIPVFASDLRLLMRNEPDYPLVLAAASTRDLGTFTLPPGAGSGDPGTIGHAAALALVPSLVNFTPSQWVVWAGVDEVVSPVLAVQFVADNGLYAQGGYEKWLFLADASTGAIVYQEDQILNVDVTGTVSGNATAPDQQGKYKADHCNDEVMTRLPYTRVNIGAVVAYADEDGDFLIPNLGESEVTVESRLWGLYFRVYNQGGADSVTTQPVIPPGPATLTHDGATEFYRAEINAYLQANRVRDFILYQNPAFPRVCEEYAFPLNVNWNRPQYDCLPTYDGEAIHLSQASGNCANMAFSTVIYHEYTHRAIEAAAGVVGFSAQGQYGEGMSDSMAVLMTDDPNFAYGWYIILPPPPPPPPPPPCDVGLRSAENQKQYPCPSEQGIHECGRLLSACIWSTRNELIVNYPATYSAILANLTVNSILLHQGKGITPQITLDFLVLDDDDAYLYNGTPHSAEICAGFGAHNMDCPAMATGMVVTPQTGLVSDGVLGGPFNPGYLLYKVKNLYSSPIDYTVQKSADWLTLSTAGATIPPHGEEYVTVTVNAAAGQEPYGTHVDTLEFTNLTDAVGDTTRPVELNVIPAWCWWTLGSDPGWTTQGQWQFGTPLGLGGAHGYPDPTSGATGDNVYGVNLSGDYLPKVGGPYYLTTAAIDLTGLQNCQLRFQRWLNADHQPYASVTIEVSLDGTTWQSSKWINGVVRITEHAWWTQTWDIPGVADNQPTVYLRWGYQNHRVGTWAYSGWNIDDIEILAEPIVP